MDTRSLRALGRRFHDDERGTAMTEFVAMLPVFITIFAGIVNMGVLQRDGVRVKIIAAKNMWTEAMSVANDDPLTGFNDHVNPLLGHVAGMDAVSQSGTGNQGGQESSLANTWHTLVHLSGFMGTKGEAERAAQFVFASGKPSGPKYGQKNFAEDITRDNPLNVLSPKGGPLVAYSLSAALSLPGSRHSYAAGTRYGAVFGEHSMNVSVGPYSTTYAAGYDVLVSPRGQEGGFVGETVVIGFSRLAIEDDSCLKYINGLGTVFSKQDFLWPFAKC